MDKQQYRINPQTLQFETVKRTRRDRWIRALLFTGVVAVVGFVSVMAFNAFFESPRTRELTRENEFLQKQLSEVNAQLDTLLRWQQGVKHRRLRSMDLQRRMSSCAERTTSYEID